MNTHKHARLTFARRGEMVRQMTEQAMSAATAAALHGVTPATASAYLWRSSGIGTGIAKASAEAPIPAVQSVVGT